MSLPPFGQLPNLRSLHLAISPNIRKIGREFYGNGGTCTKLRNIHLESMESLEEWWTTQSGGENEEFLIPNLHTLILKDCPKLKFLPYPPSMHWLLDNSDNVFPERGFGNLQSSVVPFKMTIKNCNSPNKWQRLEHFPTLEEFIVRSCSSLRTLPEAIGCFTSLVTLYLMSLEELGTLPECLGRLTSLEDVIVLDCPKLISFPESMKNLTALKTLCLKGCDGLEILPEGIGQLISLQRFYLSVCYNLTSFPESMKNLISLRIIWLNVCPGLDVFPEWLGQLTTLQELSIIRCPNLTSLPQSIQNLAELKKLHIEDCPILLQRCQGQDAHKISHIPELTLRNNEKMELPEAL
ncbi:hypothetical protein ZWY2020_027011 [Hordeum vulgare]|nr:hypothetical protein ZWY2020_027011 [Hordeum vulgare]